LAGILVVVTAVAECGAGDSPGRGGNLDKIDESKHDV